MPFDRSIVRHRFPSLTAWTAGCALVVLACAVCWTWMTWENLQYRAEQAEESLRRARRELAVRRQDEMDRKQRDHELTHVEAALRLEMERLDRLVQKQNGTAPGMGIARESVAASFPNLPLVNKNEAAGHKSEHFAIEDPAGSIHMRGPFDNLTHIGFFGALHGAHGEASMSMLSTLLSCAFPHWEAGQRELWIKKLTNVDDQVFIYRDFDHLRVTWLWMMICGIRLDVLSIETK